MPTADDIRWFKRQFGSSIREATNGTSFDVDMVVAIACQETGYVWSVLRREHLSPARVAALCVGDTIDYKGPKQGRQAFPRNKAALLAEPDGQAMFDVARRALEDVAGYVPEYRGAAAKPDKFCHGFGVFQRDLQFFKDDPGYFLERRFEDFEASLGHCLSELRRGSRKLGYETRSSLSDMEFATVAIAYNTGGYKQDKGLKQGHFDGRKFYGELIHDYLELSRQVDVGTSPVPGRYAVIARDGLKLRGGPGTDYAAERTLPAGTELDVVETTGGDPSWVRVDLEGDGLLDGYVFASFLAPLDEGVGPMARERVREP